jgi:DNA primase
MKRDKAINEIMDVITYFYEDNLQQSAYVAEEILSRLERKEMIVPPPVKDAVLLRIENRWE